MQSLTELQDISPENGLTEHLNNDVSTLTFTGYSGPFFALFHLLNLLFHGFCIATYKLFKILHLLFGFIDIVLRFLEGALFFNYNLVSSFLNFFAVASDHILIYWRLGCHEAQNFAISLIYMVLNLPSALYQLAEMMFLTVLSTFYHLVSSLCGSLAWIFGIMINLILKVEPILFGLIDIVYKAMQFVYFMVCNVDYVLVPLLDYFLMPLYTAAKYTICMIPLFFKAVYEMLLLVITSLVTLSSTLLERSYFIFKLVQSASNSLQKLGHSFVEFIIMPFSLDNMIHIFETFFQLIKSSLSLLMSSVCVAAKVIIQLINFVIIASIEIGHGIFRAFGFLVQSGIWIPIIISMFFVVLITIFKAKFILRNLTDLMKQIKTSLRRERYVAQNENNRRERRLERREDHFAQNANIRLGEEIPLEVRGGQRRREPVAQDENAREERSREPREHDKEIKEAAPKAEQEMVPDEEPHICVVCQENQRDTLILPCRHLCLCHVCIEKLPGHDIGRRCCPLCRKVIQDTLKVFM